MFIEISLSNQREQEDQNKLIERIYCGDFSPVDHSVGLLPSPLSFLISATYLSGDFPISNDLS